MKIGWSEIRKETPAVVRHIRSVIVYTIAGSLPFASILSPRLGISIEDYATWAGFVMLLAKSISMLFGVPDDAEPLKQEADIVGPRPDDRKP